MGRPLNVNTYAEAAERLQITPATLKVWIKNSKYTELNVIDRDGEKVLVKRDLDKLLIRLEKEAKQAEKDKKVKAADSVTSLKTTKANKKSEEE